MSLQILQPQTASSLQIASTTNELIKLRQPNDRTEEEISAGITPIDIRYEPGHVLRYGRNTIPGTTDMTEAIQAASVTGKLIIPPGVYRFSQIDLPANLVIEARGAVLRYDGSLTGSDVALTIGANSRFDELYVTTPGTETNSTLIRVGPGTQGEVLQLEADTQSATSEAGIQCIDPQDTKIGRVRVVNVDRPLHLRNTSTSEQTTGAWIGLLEAENYVRAFRATFCSFELGDMFVRGRSANGSQSPGHNGILIVGCKNWKTGNLWIEDAAEHAIRIGGSEDYSITEDFEIGNVVAVRPGGCAIKFNANARVIEEGVTEKASRFRIGHVLGIDVGDPAETNNEDLLRLTHVADGYIASAVAICDSAEHSAYHALRINDARNITIGVLGGTNLRGNFIQINGRADVNDTTSFPGDVIGLRIGKLTGTTAAAAAILVTTAEPNGTVVPTDFNVGDVTVDMEITGFSARLLNWEAGTIAGPVYLRGVVFGDQSPSMLGVPTGGDVMVDIHTKTRHYLGDAALIRNIGAALQLTHSGFDPGDVPACAFFANAAGVSSGVYGGAIELSRQGSSRRGGAIVVEKTGSSVYDTGLAFHFAGDTTSTDALTKTFKVLHNGSFYIPDEPVYADNAAALAGGLTAGMTYHTSTGERRVVV
jgi:hypothetical protein